MKTNPGRFFEDFRLGERIRHATPRTVTAADAALGGAWTSGSKTPSECAAPRSWSQVAKSIGMPVRVRSTIRSRSGSPGTRTGRSGSTGGEALA